MPTKKEIDAKVKMVMEYAETLIGLPYKWWTGKDDREDFHYYDEMKDNDFIKEHGIACSGFVNLLMHKAGATFPKSVAKNRGGTWFWFNRWRKREGVLQPFDYTKKYPVGTLLYRRFRDVKDQGHFAVLHSYNKKHPDKLLYGYIIHSTPDKETGGGVGISNLGSEHFYNKSDEGYYEYVVLPKDWLF